MRHLYQAITLPKISYGSNVWYSPPVKLHGSKRSTGSVKVLCQLEKTQRIATLAINGALCSTASDVLDTHANVLPMELLLLKTCHRVLIQTHTLPNTHPLHDIICTYHSCHARKHRTPLHKLLACFPLIALHHTKTISPPLFPPSHIVPFDSHVASD
jgi:hypothetical protein